MRIALNKVILPYRGHMLEKLKKRSLTRDNMRFAIEGVQSVTHQDANPSRLYVDPATRRLNATEHASIWSRYLPLGNDSISSSSAWCQEPATRKTLPPCTCAANGSARASFEPVTRSANTLKPRRLRIVFSADSLPPLPGSCSTTI